MSAIFPACARSPAPIIGVVIIVIVIMIFIIVIMIIIMIVILVATIAKCDHCHSPLRFALKACQDVSHACISITIILLTNNHGYNINHHWETIVL